MWSLFKLTINTPERGHWHIALFILLTLNKKIPRGMWRFPSCWDFLGTLKWFTFAINGSISKQKCRQTSVDECISVKIKSSSWSIYCKTRATLCFKIIYELMWKSTDLRQSTKSNSCKEIDRKSSITWIVSWKYAFQIRCYDAKTQFISLIREN